MNLSNIGLVLSLTTAVTVLPSCSGADRNDSTADRHGQSEMQAVAVGAMPGEPGHGWRYFTEVREGRAVVISPNGNYYYSDGAGLQLVFPPSEAT